MRDEPYFSKLIDKHAFSSQPNNGHYAVADMLLVSCIKTAITTNVDTLIETAGEYIFGTIEAGIDGYEVAALSPDVSPLLKIHGCRSRDWKNMIWAPGQLEVDPVKQRILNSETWLRANLLNKDILVVGFWTDWDYLNQVLAATLGAISPSRIVVVDPSDTGTFIEKAPELFDLGDRATDIFAHVQASGSDFLDSLRRKFSQTYIRKVLYSGKDDYYADTGYEPDPGWLEPQTDDNYTLWSIRRDLEGCGPNVPATRKQPHPGETLLGLTLLKLQAGVLFRMDLTGQ
ncbi:SIR2 family protein [Thiohalophilus sp.]|uniref:SIR2 family protein n=1 Tax=Thiohalophilus sp. TaxID=3028392 RepID=UPI002ACE5D0C|nr:SIR2 family protein [Thiohalophilus sp.]MDZ7802977.1 hypothetical protein [Thiohalophilus sp.]